MTLFKIFIFAILFSLSGQTQVLIDYYKGNQITGDYLRIHHSGIVEKAQRVCCPPTMKWEEVDYLTSDEVMGLKSQLREASLVPVISSTHDGRYGETYLKVFGVVDDREVLLRETTLDESKVNPSEAAENLIDLCQRYF